MAEVEQNVQVEKEEKETPAEKVEKEEVDEAEKPEAESTEDKEEDGEDSSEDKDEEDGDEEDEKTDGAPVAVVSPQKRVAEEAAKDEDESPLKKAKVDSEESEKPAEEAAA